MKSAMDMRKPFDKFVKFIREAKVLFDGKTEEQLLSEYMGERVNSLVRAINQNAIDQNVQVLMNDHSE